MVFEKIQCCPDPKSHCLPSIKLFHIYGKIDLEKLITTNPVSDFFTETFDLLSARPFENLVFRPESQGGQISGSPELVGTLPQAPFFSTKKGPIFLEALNLWVRCRRRLFFPTKKGPIFLGTDHEGTARDVPGFMSSCVQACSLHAL